MADSLIGALRVILGLDTAAFSQGAKDAQSSLDKLTGYFTKAIAGLGIYKLGEQFAESVKKAIDAADELGKASQKFGVPVEQLSGLKYAADLADVSFEALGKGLGKLSKAMLDGAVNPSGEAAKSFKALGVSVNDSSGNIKQTDTVFLELADKFSSMQDGAAKTALAIRVFGKAGADLIPLLNQGSGAIKGLQEEAAKLGIVISAQTAAHAEEFNDTLKRIHAASQGVYLQVAEALLPALQLLANAFVKTNQEGGFFKSVIQNLVTDEDIYSVQKFVQGIENLARVFAALRALPANIKSMGLTAAFDELDNAIAINAEKLADLARAYNNSALFKGFLDNLNTMITGFQRGFGGIDTSALAATNAIDQFIKSQEKSIASTNAEAQAMGLGLGVAESFRITMEARAIALANNITLTDKQTAAIKRLSEESAAAAVNLAGAKLTQEFLSPWDQYQKKLSEINQMLGAQIPISAETAAKASAAAAAKMTETYGNAAATAAGNFATFFNTFAKGNATMFAIGKAFSISQAIINTYVGATKALAELGPVLGPIAAAGIIAAGLAQVAKIVAEKPAKMALGGSMMVGGAGGTDSQLVPIMATPGERVTVDQNKYGDSGGGKTITVEGVKPKDYYRGDVLRDIIENLNQAIGDGYKLKVA